MSNQDNAQQQQPETSTAGGGASAPPPRPPLWSRPWFPVALAAGVAGLALLWLHLPGVLLYPSRFVAPAPPVAPVVDERQVALQRQHNESLRQQIAAGRQLLDKNVCVQNGELFVPAAPPIPLERGRSGGTATATAPSGGRSQPGLGQGGQGQRGQSTPGQSSGQPGEPDTPEATAPQGHRPVTPEEGGSLVPKPAEQLKPSTGALPSQAPFEGNLVDLLDKATVLVVVPGKGLGSGFFIAKDKLVTNRHVVEGAPSGVFVTNKLLGSLKPVQVGAMSQRTQRGAGGPDYAILQIEPQQNAPVLALTSNASRLQRVIAAGYPGIVTKADEKFDAMRRGERNAIPEMALTNGTVTVVQNRASGLPIIGHEANISPGSSGGPLVDECGRVIGVNTFGLFDESGRHHVNYALGAEGLAEFLKANGVQIGVTADACQAQSSPAPIAGGGGGGGGGGAQPATAVPASADPGAARAPAKPAGAPTEGTRK